MRPSNVFLIRHCCETRLFVSCTSTELEHMFVVQIRVTLRLKLIWNLAHLGQKMRHEIIQLCSPEFRLQQQHCLIMLCVMDVTYQNRASLLSQALFHLVTDRASMLTVQSKSGLSISGQVQAFQYNLCTTWCQFSCTVEIFR